MSANSSISNIARLNKINLSDLFPNFLFWDVDIDGLSIENDDDFIIKRVLSRCENNEGFLAKLEQLYSEKLIRSYALSSPEINGNEHIEFLAKRYNLKPQDFNKYLDLLQYA